MDDIPVYRKHVQQGTDVGSVGVISDGHTEMCVP